MESVYELLGTLNSPCVLTPPEHVRIDKLGQALNVPGHEGLRPYAVQ